MGAFLYPTCCDLVCNILVDEAAVAVDGRMVGESCLGCVSLVTDACSVFCDANQCLRELRIRVVL